MTYIKKHLCQWWHPDAKKSVYATKGFRSRINNKIFYACDKHHQEAKEWAEKTCPHRKGKEIPKSTGVHIMGYSDVPKCPLCGKEMIAVFLPGNNFECECCLIDEFGQDRL